MNLEGVTEKLLNEFTGPDYEKEVGLAKREFFENAGLLNDEDHQFELRMTQFLDWYLFTRELSQYQLSPIRYALHEKKGFSHEDFEVIDLMSHAIHSLFEFLKTRGEDIYVKDLFDGKKYVLKSSPVNLGFNRDELFEARIIPTEDNFRFANGFCIHPSEAKKFILREIKKVRKLTVDDREALMFRLMKMRYKHEQYSHIKIDYIYTNDPKLKF